MADSGVVSRLVLRVVAAARRGATRTSRASRASSCASPSSARAGATDHGDLYLRPRTDTVSLMDFKAFDELIDIGFRDADPEIAKWFGDGDPLLTGGRVAGPSTSRAHQPVGHAVPDGLVAIVKRDCPTCTLVGPVLADLRARFPGAVTVYSQDDPTFPEATGGAIDDRDLDVELRPRPRHRADAGADRRRR